MLRESRTKQTRSIQFKNADLDKVILSLENASAEQNGLVAIQIVNTDGTVLNFTSLAELKSFANSQRSVTRRACSDCGEGTLVCTNCGSYQVDIG